MWTGDISNAALWLSEIRRHFAEDPDSKKVILRLVRKEDVQRDYTLFLPPAASEEAFRFQLRYVASTVYNILSVFSGSALCFYCGEETKALLLAIPPLFEGSDSGYGKVIHIARRFSEISVSRFSRCRHISRSPPLLYISERTSRKRCAKRRSPRNRAAASAWTSAAATSRSQLRSAAGWCIFSSITGIPLRLRRRTA